MSWSRTPAVAGLFYPAQASALREDLRRYLEAAGDPGRKPGAGEGSGAGATRREGRVPERPKALIVPHAGYIYSGPVAASAYARLSPLADSIERVVLLGPAHRLPFRGLAASSAEAFETPLGRVELDREGIAEALKLPQVRLLDEAHEGEHSLEVHLPFLQVVLGSFRLIPLVVGDAGPEEVAEVLERLWGGPETLVVISTDLSHYLPYERAVDVDSRTADAVERLRPEEIGPPQACGRIPMAGLLLRAREEGLRVACVDLRNSGDTAGPRNQVVGYGSFLVG